MAPMGPTWDRHGTNMGPTWDRHGTTAVLECAMSIAGLVSGVQWVQARRAGPHLMEDGMEAVPCCRG